MLARNGIFRAILPLDQELSWAIQHRKGKEFRNAIYKLSLAAALYFLRGGSNLRIFQCKSRVAAVCSAVLEAIRAKLSIWFTEKFTDQNRRLL